MSVTPQRSQAWLERHRTRLPQADPAVLADERLLWAVSLFIQIQLDRKTGEAVFSFRDGVPVKMQPGFAEYPPQKIA